jgi:hypothetical protein
MPVVAGPTVSGLNKSVVVIAEKLRDLRLLEIGCLGMGHLRRDGPSASQPPRPRLCRPRAVGVREDTAAEIFDDPDLFVVIDSRTYGERRYRAALRAA